MLFSVVLSVAFVTLFERHLLRLSQNRLGPNKVSFFGVLQAAFDGVKLLFKEQVFILFSSKTLFIFVPGFSFLIIMFDWFIPPYFMSIVDIEFSLLLLLCFVGVFVYTTLLSGLISKSKYGILGAIRSSSQSVSYEISFTFLFLGVVVHYISFNFFANCFFDMFFLIVPLFISIVCELNRAPFDLSEGESELVRGFNTEYSRVAFVLLFLREYGVIIFFSVIFRVIFFNFSLFFCFVGFSLIIFVRRCFPRVRYDFVIYMFWFVILPISIIILFFFFSFYYWLVIFFLIFSFAL